MSNKAANAMYEKFQDKLDHLAHLNLEGNVHLNLNRSHIYDLVEHAHHILTLRYQNNVPDRSLDALAAAMEAAKSYNIPVFINRIEQAFVIAEQPPKRKSGPLDKDAPLRPHTDKLLDALTRKKTPTT